MTRKLIRSSLTTRFWNAGSISGKENFVVESIYQGPLKSGNSENNSSISNLMIDWENRMITSDPQRCMAKGNPVSRKHIFRQWNWTRHILTHNGKIRSLDIHQINDYNTFVAKGHPT
jgi:hypothetical protein